VNKIQKVAMEFLQPDGSVMVRTLEGDQAEGWDEALANVTVFAAVHRANPNWGKFLWKTTYRKPDKRKANKRNKA
jgi:hypothetical protein